MIRIKLIQNNIHFVLISILMILFSYQTKIFANELSIKEKLLKQKVVLSIGDNWEPYYSKTLPRGGVMVQIVRESFKRVGYELELKWFPWTRAFNLAKVGKYDGVLGAWYTEERTKFFDYSLPFFSTELVFFKRKGDNIIYNSLQDLKQYKIGVARDSGPYEILKTDFEKNLKIATSADTNILKLVGKRFDLLADEKLNVLYLINDQFPFLHNSLEILDPPLQINNLHVIISKKNPNSVNIVNDFNRGLKAIKKDGTFDNLLKEYKFYKD